MSMQPDKQSQVKRPTFQPTTTRPDIQFKLHPELQNTGDKKLTARTRAKAEGLPSKSEVIRFLDTQGFNRAEISRLLNVRYQHVRNVELRPLTSQASRSWSPETPEHGTINEIAKRTHQ